MRKLFMLVLMGALVAACSDDDDNNNTEATFALQGFPSAVELEAGESATYPVTSSGDLIMDLQTPKGWKFAMSDSELKLTAPSYPQTKAYSSEDQSDIQYSGTVTIKAYNGSHLIAEYSAPVQAMQTLTFEGVPESYMAGPTSYGANLYSEFEGTQYTGYHDTATGLKWGINENDGVFDFYSGGVAVSRWHDTTTEGYENQCSVYNIGASKPGYGNSETFAVVTGTPNGYGGDYGSICFADSDTEKIIDRIFVCNTTYGALTMKNGNDFAKEFTYEDKDWFKLIVTGFDKGGAQTGTAEFYLADFRTADAGGILSEWAEMELSSLGKVNKLQFGYESSDTGDYGINTPTYVCVDNLSVRL